MQVSFGDLPLAEELMAELIPENGLKFSWNPEWLTDTNPDDQVMLLAYNVANRDAHYTITVQFRKTGGRGDLIVSIWGKLRLNCLLSQCRNLNSGITNLFKRVITHILLYF